MICFFKQKTAYEMRISDWSSDVCSSDLLARLDEAIDLVEWPRLGAVDALVHVVLGQIPRTVIAHGDDDLAQRPQCFLLEAGDALGRSEERRVGKECVSTCRFRWLPEH